MSAAVIRVGVLDCQACVPKDWTDEQVVEFVNSSCLCGTTNGWSIRREGSILLKGCPERKPCAARDGYVHITLDA